MSRFSKVREVFDKSRVLKRDSTVGHEDVFDKTRTRHSSREPNLEASCDSEVEVIKAILLREEYIDLVKASLDNQGSKFGKDQGELDYLVSLIDLLRSITVETCEAIRHWRTTQGQPSMLFVWKGANYLLKIPVDIDFLDDHKLLRTWLGFSLRRNPFLCTFSLETLAGVSGETINAGHDVNSLDRRGFDSVGGSQACGTAGGMQGDCTRAPRLPRVGGNAIADGYMVRIKEAATMIVQEEATHGRYTMDSCARFVPVESAEKVEFSRQLKLDDKRRLLTPANAPRDLAPFTDIAGIGHALKTPYGGFGRLASYACDRRDPSRSLIGHSASGKASAKRAGGRLRPVTVHSTPPRKMTPVVRRSIGATLRAEMISRKQQNRQLQTELEALRHHLATAYSVDTEQAPEENYLGTMARKRVCESEVLGLGTIADFSDTVAKIKQASEELERRARRELALEKQLRLYQVKERDRVNKKLARVLERKRRLLEQDLDLIQHEVDDEYTFEDGAATRIQRIVRGVQGRTRVRKLRPILNNAATLIQGTIRGHLGRLRAELKRVDMRSVKNIQRVWRGYLGRSATVSALRKRERSMAARNIQRIARGRYGRRRVDHKRALRESARNGAEVVGVKQLFHQDIVELADAVGALLVDSSRAQLPGIVLGLLKVTALMLEEDEELGAITRYSPLGVQSIEKVQPMLQFSWRDALSLLRRSHKLLRRLRQVAEGPSSRRSRIVYFSEDAIRTYAALRCDQGWNVATIGRVGRGAKACQHLMMWVDALQQVFAYQREFADDLGSDRMPWVARAQQSLRCMRHLKLSCMVWEHAVTIVQQILHDAHEVAPKHFTHLPAAADSKSRRGDLRLCVAENSLEKLRSRENSLKDALCKMRHQEEDAQRDDEARERLREDALAEDLNHAELSLAESLTRLKEAKRVAQDGTENDQVQLQLILEELTKWEIFRRERWTSLEMFKVQRRRNAKRRGVDVEVWGNLRHEVRVVGELEAASYLAAEDLRFASDHRDGGLPAADSRDNEVQLLQAKVKESQALAAAAQERLDALEEEQENAHTIASEAELQKEETVLSLEWNDPSEEEREEDLREDEQCARWEAELGNQHVPVAMVARPFQRPRPIILCLSRDVPASSKSRIVKQLECDLPGLTVHIDEEESMGLHIGNLQQALSIRCSVICNVDIGIGATRRKAFLQRLATVKHALIPTPNFILVVGDSKNRSGGPLNSSVGCSRHDLSVMGDGEIKRRLEDLARTVKEIQDPAFLDMMANMGQQVTPPSQAHILVMEALIILLTPQTVFHNHIPLSSVRGVTWTEARHILSNPDKVWAAIARVDACNIPPANLCTLQVYIGHDKWPSTCGAAIGDDNVVNTLAAWACLTIEVSVLLTNAGGNPEAMCHYSTAHVGLLAAVVPVYDDSSHTQSDQMIDSKRGWRPAYVQTVTAVLEDVRVFRVAKRVHGAEGVHLVEVYQECGRLFFNTYDPDSCVSSFCVVEETQISHLLAPALDQPPEFGPNTVPSDRHDMFARLVALLSFEAVSLLGMKRQTCQAGVPRLTCQRRLRRLLRDTRQVSGHFARVTVYDEAKGELLFCLYLAEYASKIQLKVDASTMEKVLQDSDKNMGERQAITSEDTRRLLEPITDRLVITPSRTVVSTMSAGHGLSKRESSSNQGLNLKIRCKGGPGRRVVQAVYLISGTCHVVTAWELGRGGLLRVTAYDPTTSVTYEARLSTAERACFGYDGEDRKSWFKHLVGRLSLRKAREFSETENGVDPLPRRRTMIVDKTVFSTACRVAAGRIDARLFRMRAVLVDAGRSLALDLYQADTSKHCRIHLSEDELLKVSAQPSKNDVIVEHGGDSRNSAQGFKMASLLVVPKHRESALRQLTRQLRFFPDSDSLTLSVNGDSKTTAMGISSAVKQRRPQSCVEGIFSQPVVNAGSQNDRSCGFAEGFLRQRRQPHVLLHGSKSGRTQHSPESTGNTGVAGSAFPRCGLEFYREAAKRKKVKQKRRIMHKKPLNEAQKAITAPSEVSESDIRAATNRGAHLLLQVLNSKLEDETIESEIDSFRSTTGIAPMHLPRDGEYQVYQGAISIRLDDWEVHQPVCDTIVIVYGSPEPGEDSAAIIDKPLLRAAVYYTKMGAYAEVSIKDFQDLRQVVGALHQSLAYQWQHQPKDAGVAEALLKFIFHHRAMIKRGTWDDSRDEYVEHGSGFTVLLKRNRLYRSFKQTPIHLSGSKDEHANAHQIIDDASRRGKKVFRRAVNVSSTLFQITAYELPLTHASQDRAPTLRFIAYDPKTQMQLVALIRPEVVLELAGGPHSPWMAPDKREVLAEILAQALRLRAGHDGSPTLVMPWSGENLAFVDEIHLGETWRPRRDKVLACAKREELSRLEVFSTRVSSYEVIITVFVKTDALAHASNFLAQDVDNEGSEGPMLTFNLQCPKLSQSVDIDLPHALQKMMTGRNILNIPKGEARSSAIRRTARFLCISSSPSSRCLQAEFLFQAQTPWLVAYNELVTLDHSPSRRPRGQPLAFIPGDTDGDLILSKGVSIDGFKVLLSVHTKARGCAGREGLVLEVYNAETSASSILHLSATHLLKQVDAKDHLLEDGRLVGTIHLLTKRLHLKKSATGGWKLCMDRNLSPFLFMGM